MDHATNMDVLVTVGAALGTAIPAYLAYLAARKTRRENAEQHGVTADNLIGVQQSVLGLAETVAHVAESVGELKGDVRALQQDICDLKGRNLDGRAVE